MAKKTNFGHDLGPFTPNLGPKKFVAILPVLVEIIPSYHLMQFEEKLMSETWENDKTINFRSILTPLPQFNP